MITVKIYGITVTDKLICHCINTSTMEKHKFYVDKNMHKIMHALMMGEIPINLKS